MCHSSCATCSTESFTSCLTCKGTNLLYESVCYCKSPWNDDCAGQAQFQGIFRLFHSMFILSFILLIILYCLKIKLPMSYRVLSGLQFMSLLIYSKTIYLDYEDFYILKLFNYLSGPYMLSYRLQTVSTSHVLQTYILLAFFFFLFFVLLYYPSQTFHKKSQSYWPYIKENFFEYLENFYYFGGKMMFLYIGMLLAGGNMSDYVMIAHLVVLCLLILVVVVRLVMEYHKNSLSEEVYPAHLYLYSMIFNSAAIGIPLIKQSTMLLPVYLSPLGLLVLIAILNRDMKILHKETIKFFLVELLMMGLCACMIIFNDQIKTYVLMCTLSICSMIIVGESALIYHGGMELSGQDGQKAKRSANNKIHPTQNNQSENQISNQQKERTVFVK